MSSCLWRVVVGMALFVATLEVPVAVAKEPTAITDQTKSFEGPDRDAAHEAAMKWIDDLNQHGPLRIKQIVVVERGHKWIATVPTPRASNVSRDLVALSGARSGAAHRRNVRRLLQEVALPLSR